MIGEALVSKPDAQLTPLQERFVAEYLVDLNGRQAAIRAGYSARCAADLAYRNLHRPAIAAAVDRGLRQAFNTTRARVVEELAAIAFADAADFFAWGPDGVSVKASAGLDSRLTRAVAEVSETRTSGGGAIRVKLADKLAALEKLGRALGMFREQPANETPEAEPPSADRREVAKAVLAILAAAEAEPPDDQDT